jgi:hypothetical protein
MYVVGMPAAAYVENPFAAPKPKSSAWSSPSSSSDKVRVADALTARSARFVRSRTIEKEPPRHGEKPFGKLVTEAFDGPVLRLSQRISLLEEADRRQIRRGDALDLIAATQREFEARHAVKPPSKVQEFVTKYAAFAACYVAFALSACAVMAR